MKYIFEDKRENIIHKFFGMAYNNDFPLNSIYTNSNNKLVDCLAVVTGVCNISADIIKDKYNKEILAEWDQKQDSGDIFVFVDVAPTNSQTVKIYESIRGFIVEHNLQSRVYVFPIPCIEYYVLLSLLENNIVIGDRKYIAEMCKNKRVHYEIVQEIVENIDNWGDIQVSKEAVIRFNKSFEKVCKTLLRFVALPCARTEGDQEYYYSDCVCSNPIKVISNSKLITDNLGDITKTIVNTTIPCHNKALSMEKKLESFFEKLKYFPSGSILENTVEIMPEDYTKIHKKLVDEINSFIKCYISYMMNNGLEKDILSLKMRLLEYII